MPRHDRINVDHSVITGDLIMPKLCNMHYGTIADILYDLPCKTCKYSNHTDKYGVYFCKIHKLPVIDRTEKYQKPYEFCGNWESMYKN